MNSAKPGNIVSHRTKVLKMDISAYKKSCIRKFEG